MDAQRSHDAQIALCPEPHRNRTSPGVAAVHRPLASALAVLVLGALGSVGLERLGGPHGVVQYAESHLGHSTANGTPGGGTLVLAPGSVYSLESANNTTEGGTGIPVIAGKVMIPSWGDTIADQPPPACRPSASST